MTAQLPLTLLPAGAIEIGDVAALVEDETGGRVFVRGELVFAWDGGDELGRRLAAVQLVRGKGARAVRVAAGFGVNTEALRRWEGAVSDAGAAALMSGNRGPKGPTRLTVEVVADIRTRCRGASGHRQGGRGQRGLCAAGPASAQGGTRTGVVATGGLTAKTDQDSSVVNDDDGDDVDDVVDDDDETRGEGKPDGAAVDLLVLLPPADCRAGERAAAR